MSRSLKKPFISITGKNKSMREWKNNANKLIRRKLVDEDIPDGNFYRLITDNWTSPRDGSPQYCPNDVKVTRK
jgi:hypothetical protein